MQETIKAGRKPKIMIGESDFAKLNTLADSFAERSPELSDELYAELERAKVVPDRSVPDNIVRMGSIVEYKPVSGEARTITLVYPAEADIAQGRVSILTPIGTALLGLAPGQSITWLARDGRRHELSVIKVSRPDDIASGEEPKLAGTAART